MDTVKFRKVLDNSTLHLQVAEVKLCQSWKTRLVSVRSNLDSRLVSNSGHNALRPLRISTYKKLVSITSLIFAFEFVERTAVQQAI